MIKPPKAGKRQALSDKDAPPPKVRKAKKTGDEIWEELLATPESEAFLTLMVAEVREEKRKGRMIEGGFGEV